MIAAACGFDAVYIDLEHNPTSLETAAAVCVAALAMGVTPIARVTSHDPHDATRILDCGAQGVMVPHVQNAEEATAIVAACLYAPKGHRSAFGSGPALGYAALGQAEVCRRLNEETLLMAMIETPEAVGNADAIAAVDGIDVLHIGASDLSTEMGIPGQYTHDRMRSAFETVAKAAGAHGKAMGVGGVRQDFEFQSWLLRLGVRYLTGGSDVATRCRICPALPITATALMFRGQPGKLRTSPAPCPYRRSRNLNRNRLHPKDRKRWIFIRLSLDNRGGQSPAALGNLSEPPRGCGQRSSTKLPGFREIIGSAG
jgi:4-hydroxy-2-oxoheptanedioate aldolase